MESTAEIAQHQRPRFAYLHHISLPCRDVEESKRFYIQVLVGELIHDIPGFAEVRIADIVFGISQQSGGWTGPTVEYPHYALNVDGKNFALARRWLDACGVPQHGWTRNYKTSQSRDVDNRIESGVPAENRHGEDPQVGGLTIAGSDFL